MPSYKDIQRQIATLQRQADEARKKEVAAAIADIRAKMDEYGLTVADIQKGATKGAAKGGRGKRAGKAAPAARSASAPQPKYKDPVSGSTWSGRGRKPGWIIAAIEQNRPLDDFLIK
ncbi:MAG: H-NS histone family protein [Spirochaetaceae bacterium]|nr:MAG: H-NS histone family protein [Spirochaetaceae bacterium]